MINLFKQIGVAGLVVAGLLALGATLNAIIPWEWLTYFFALIRAVVRPLAFIWDFDSLFEVFGYVLSVLIGIWSFKAVLVVRNFFDNSYK